MPLKAILIRVGIDQTFGNWNAPCNPETNDFVYVPIPQSNCLNAKGLEKFYKDSAVPALSSFSDRNGITIDLPKHLKDQRMHLDPDFNHLSYGDTKDRGRVLLDFNEDDVLVFYSSYQSIENRRPLVYALMGILRVESVKKVNNIAPQYFDENAHTRYVERIPTDIVVKGKAVVSGRFKHCIPIGEFRNNSYRVRNDILEEWGDLTVNDGWIQRSANPPLFKKPEKFLSWLSKQNPVLINSNN